MNPYVAFMDDSGNPHPMGPGEFFVLAIVAFPMDALRDFNDVWALLVSDHTGYTQDQARITEIHCSDLYDHYKRLLNGNAVLTERPLSHSSQDQTESLIQAIWDFIATGKYKNIEVEPPKFVSIVIHKESNWRRFTKDLYQKWLLRNHLKLNKREVKSLEDQLVGQIVDNAFGFVSQRLEYLMEDTDVDGITVYIGDECAANKRMFEIQGLYSSGMGNFTRLRRIVNNIAFGSSNFNPGLQAADWAAFALAGWARQVPWLSDRLRQLLPRFRGCPSAVQGRGIVLNPDNYEWPELPG